MSQNGKSPHQFTTLAPHYDELMQIVPYDAWGDYVFTLLQVAEHDAKRLLDCCCGTGNVSFELAKSGVEVTGVDIAPDMIAVAQTKAANSTLPIRFFEADLTDFDLGESFDCATCLYDSLNYILDPRKLEAAFACVARHIEVGGVWVFDMNSEYAITADLFTQQNLDPRKALHYDWNAKYDPATRTTTVEMLFSRQESDGTVSKFTEQHQERAYTMTEVNAMLERTGWDVLKTYDAYTLNPPHSQSERWFWVVQKR